MSFFWTRTSVTINAIKLSNNTKLSKNTYERPVTCINRKSSIKRYNNTSSTLVFKWKHGFEISECIFFDHLWCILESLPQNYISWIFCNIITGKVNKKTFALKSCKYKFFKIQKCRIICLGHRLVLLILVLGNGLKFWLVLLKVSSSAHPNTKGMIWVWCAILHCTPW